jgi:Tol biopolymer transport system component
MVAFCALVQLFAPQVSQAQGDHRLVWRTLRTEHFSIHYHEPLGLLARHFAAQAEAIHGRVSSGLGLTVAQHVEVILSDEDDSANGSATPLPYNTIRLRAVAPDDWSALGDYDDWPTMLLTHEHTHILHLEHATGLPRLIQAIFGRSYTPQQYLPPWMIEGLAVVTESAHTTGGRVRSTLFDMYMRMDALENRILGIDWIGFDGEPWPHGHVRYLYGSAFLQFVASRYGERALGRFVEEYGARLVPYGINRAAKRATGKTYVALYEEFKADLRERANAVDQRVRAEGLVAGTRITFHGETTRSPRYLPNGDVVYMVADERHVPELRTISLAHPEHVERITRIPNVGSVVPEPGGKRFLYSTTAYHRGVYAFNELYTAERGDRRGTQITEAFRAREPDISPDGKHVVYVTHGAGTSHLVLADRADIEHTRRMLVRSREREQVFTPRFSPDGKRVAYSAMSTGGYRDLWLVELETGMRTRLTYDRALDRGPVFSRDGRTLYFSSDRTGIANLYAYDLAGGQITQITNVVGGAYSPDVSPDGRALVYVGYSSKGFDLFTLELEKAAEIPAPPSFARDAPLLPLPPLAQLSKPYQPARTLLPRAWNFSLDDSGDGQQLVLSTTGGDAVGFHAWSLALTQNLDHEDRLIEVGYSYKRPRFPVNVRWSMRDRERTNLIVNEDNQPWKSRGFALTIGTRFSWPRALRAMSLRTDYAITYAEKREPFVLDVNPNYAPPTLPTLGLDTRWVSTFQVATAQRQAYDISQSWGYVLDVSASVRDPYLGSQDRDLGFSWRYEQFFRFDFRESVIALAYNGAWDTSVSVGGLPAQVGPIYDYIVGSRGSPVDYARLRGFPRRVGDKLSVVQLEYRALVTRINRGLQTLPVFARRLHAAVFTDIGDAWSGTLQLSRIGVGVGAELRFDWSSDYGRELTLRLGVAQGLTQDGQFQWYLSMTKLF